MNYDKYTLNDFKRLFLDGFSLIKTFKCLNEVIHRSVCITLLSQMNLYFRKKSMKMLSVDYCEK